FLSALTEAEKDSPGFGDLCLRCHAPGAWLSGRCIETDGRLLEPTDSGVTCSVCHRMDESPYQRNGQYVIGEDLDYRGPYSDAEAPPHNQSSAFISDSRLCGTCHDFHNPLVENFAEQTTYTEWATSAFAGPGGQSCQDCHLPEDEFRVAKEGPVRPDRS